MEIFIKADNKTHKINWLSSIPDKYKQDMLKKIREHTLGEELAKQKLNSTSEKRSKRRRSQETAYRDMSKKELAKLKGLLGFQGASYVDQAAQDTGETFEIILNIKANKSPIRKTSQPKPPTPKEPHGLPPRSVPKNFMPQFKTLKPLKSMNKTGSLPNLLKPTQNQDKTSTFEKMENEEEVQNLMTQTPDVTGKDLSHNINYCF